MARFKRISAVSALAAYLLVTTAIHALHDHSGAEPGCCSGVCHAAGHDDHDSKGHDSHGGRHANCEDTCFACRFLAVKTIAATPVEVEERVDAVYAAPESEPLFVAAPRPALPLSRGPPCA